MRMKDSRVFRRPIAGRAVLAAATALLTLPMAAAQLRPSPRNHVDDGAGVIDRRTYQALDRYLTELEQKTGTQMIVLTIDSTAGVPISEYALNTAESWKLGQKGKDNGVLIVIAVKDRKYRIETGYGVEGVLPDGLCSRVADAHFKPNFRKGNYSKGIFDGTLVLANRVADEARVAISGMPKRGPPRGHRSGGRTGIARLVGALVPFFLIFFVFIRFKPKNIQSRCAC